jgi:uncharacterized protein (DUF4415 family)
MPAKKELGVAEWVDPDDAPELTDAFFDKAEVWHGDTFIRRADSASFGRRGRGRPKSDAPKEQINIRLDADVLALLRQNGPGWQTKVNAILRASLGLVESGASASPISKPR